MNKAKKSRPSGPAILMYCMIAICILTAAVCFWMYYGNGDRNDGFLWVGIVTFMIVYHLGLRLIMGNATKLFKIHYNQRWFCEMAFERKLYKLLRVKRWKGKALTYHPESFSLKERTLEQIANTMAKSEVDHWVNEVISLSSMLFSILWGQLWIFALTAFAAMLFDGQFIVIQRYNRPRVLRILQKGKNR